MGCGLWITIVADTEKLLAKYDDGDVNEFSGGGLVSFVLHSMQVHCKVLLALQYVRLLYPRGGGE